MAAPGYAATAFSNGYQFTQGKGYVLPEYPFVEPPEIASGKLGQHPIVIVGGGLAGLTPGLRAGPLRRRRGAA